MARPLKEPTDEDKLAVAETLKRQEERIMGHTTRQKDGVPAQCICCGTKNQGNFYSARGDRWHRASKKLPYCKACCNEIYRSYVVQYKQNYNVALYFTCRKLDIPYVGVIYKKAIHEINDPNSQAYGIENLFQAYMVALYKDGTIVANNFDMSSGESDIEGLSSYDAVVKVRRNTGHGTISSKDYEVIEMDVEDLRTKWGDFSNDDLAYLESEYLDWDAQLNGIHDKYQEINVEQVCLQRNEIRHDRERGEDVTKKLAAFRTLLKDSGLDGLQANEAAAQGVSMTIRDIEYHRPVKQVDKDFEDVDGVRLILDAYLGGTSRAVGKENEYTERFDKEYSQYNIDIIDSLAANRKKGLLSTTSVDVQPTEKEHEQPVAPKKRGRPSKQEVSSDAKKK